MAADDTIPPEDQPGSDPAEGIRLIAADEVDKVAERENVARRRRAGEPKYGDRPPAPPDDLRPTIRFPLPDAADPGDIARPRVAPVERRVAEGSVDPAPEPDDVDASGLDEAADPGEVDVPAAQHADDLDGLDGDVEPVDDLHPAVDDDLDDLQDLHASAAFDDVTADDEPLDAPPTAVHDELVIDDAAPEPVVTGGTDAEAGFDEPAQPSTEGDPDAAWGAVASVPGGPDDPLEAVAPAPEADEPAPAPAGPVAAPADPAPPHGDPLTGPPAFPPAGEAAPQVIVGDVSEPVLDLGPPTGESALPHWTEPATGQVPRIVAAEDLGTGDPDEEQRWTSYAAGATRWRDEHDTTDHGDLVADLAAIDEGEDDHRLGALDTSERTSDEAYLNFDDVDLAAEAERRTRSRRLRGRRRPAEGPPPGDPIDLTTPVLSGPPLPPPPPSPEPPVDDLLAPAVEAPAAEAPEEPVARRPRRPRPPRPTDTPPPPPPDEDPAAPRPRRRARPEEPVDGGGGSRDVTQAAIVGIAIAAVALIAFAVGPAAAMIVVTVVVALAGAEYFGAMQRGGFRPATLVGLVAVTAFPLAAYWRGEAAYPLIMFLSIVVGVLWYLLGVGGKVRPTANLGVTLLGILWVGGLGAFAALILDIPAEGVSILLVTIVAAVAADVGGFFVGRAMGRTPLIAASPNKTVEGLVGGVLGTLVAVFVVAVVLDVGPFSAGQALVFGLVTALAAPLGDLAESLVKRDLGLKDMGTLLPQHGGLLDRFDGILFVLPTAYFVVRAFGLAG